MRHDVNHFVSSAFLEAAFHGALNSVHSDSNLQISNENWL